jgi:hypothetical protein
MLHYMLGHGHSRRNFLCIFFLLVLCCLLTKITKGVHASWFLPYFRPSRSNMAHRVCTLGMPNSTPDIGYRPKRRVEDPLLALVVDAASVSRAVLHKRF